MPWSQPFWTLPVGLWDEDAYTSQLEPLEPVIDLFKSWFWRLCTSLCLWMCQGLIPKQNSVYYLVCGSWPQYRKTCDLLNLLVVFISPALSDLYCEIAQVLAQREIARRHDAKRVHHSVCLVNSYRPEPYQCLHSTYVLIWVESSGGDESSRHHIAMDPEACLGILSRAHAAHAKRSLAAISTKQSGKLAWNFTEFSLGP